MRFRAALRAALPCSVAVPRSPNCTTTGFLPIVVVSQTLHLLRPLNNPPRHTPYRNPLPALMLGNIVIIYDIPRNQILVVTHRPLSSSFLWFIFRILNGNPKKELH